VVNGVVYAGCGNNVCALTASTGALLWSYSTGGYTDSSPAVANEVVYAGAFTPNATLGNLYALDASGVVYVGSDIGNMYALNASTGALLWKYDAGGVVISSPAVANGVVYFGSLDRNVYALDANTGTELWSYATGDQVNSSPAVANGVVYVGSNDGKVYALNASTGALIWVYTTGSFVFSSPTVTNGVVYFGSGDNKLYALNASTGAKLWSYTTTGPVTSSPAVANGVVYFGSYDGNEYALNAGTGAKLWSYSTGRTLDSTPSIVDGVAYVQGGIFLGNGVIYAFALSGADLFLRIKPTPTTVHQGDLLTYAFPVWNLGPDVAEGEVLSSLQVPAGTTFDYLRISGTPGLGTCTHPPYGGTGQIICHEGDGMAPNTTWTVRLTVKVTAPAGTVITANAATMADTPDPNLANNTATVSLKVQ